MSAPRISRRDWLKLSATGALSVSSREEAPWFSVG